MLSREEAGHQDRSFPFKGRSFSADFQLPPHRLLGRKPALLILGCPEVPDHMAATPFANLSSL